MKKIKSIIISLMIFIFLIVVTYSLIFKNISILSIYNELKSLNFMFILIAICLMFIYILIESINIKNILNSLGEKISIKKALKYTFINFFFSSITPASTGGEPVEIYYMSKDNIQISNATLTLLITLCGNHICSVLIAFISIILNPKILTNKLLIIFIIGNILNTIPITITLIGIFKENLSVKLSNLIKKIFSKLKIKKAKKIMKKIDLELDNYHKSMMYIKYNKKTFIKSIFLSFIHTIVYYSIPFFIYQSFNLKMISMFKFMELQSILYSTVCSIPLPGSVLASESVFILIYNQIYGSNLVKSAMLVNRFIMFYLFVIISLIIVIINHIKIRKNNSKIVKKY